MLTNDICEITKIDAQNLSIDETNNLYIADSIMTDKYGFLKRYKNADEYKSAYLPIFNGEDNELFSLCKNDKIHGILAFVKGFDWSGKEQYKLIIKLCDTAASIPLDNCLRQFILKKLELHGQIAITAYDNEFDERLKELSTKVQLKSNNYTLTKTDIDVGMLKEAAEALQVKNNDLRMVYSNALPEEYIEQYCNLFNELQEAMPDVAEDGFVQYVESPEKLRGRIKSNAERNITHHCYMVFNASGDMVAQSNVAVNNNDPRFPYQFLIGVTEQYRGRSLGKWLYAVMYQKLFTEIDFEKVHVAHHPLNKHIIAVSEWVGYKFAFLETTYIL
ncbi:MAG: hypothetical protein FWC92_12070 [Defluviitaleaceae bacterium]|nr:hypothetical protein [Defluviitaleaceae bacterium]